MYLVLSHAIPCSICMCMLMYIGMCRCRLVTSRAGRGRLASKCLLLRMINVHRRAHRRRRISAVINRASQKFCLRRKAGFHKPPAMHWISTGLTSTPCKRALEKGVPGAAVVLEKEVDFVCAGHPDLLKKIRLRRTSGRLLQAAGRR